MRSTHLDRRTLLQRLALGITTFPLLNACTGTTGNGDVDAPTSSVDAPPVTGGWAGGGTASMTDKGSYPDPFTGTLTSCLLVASTTEGPCTTATDLDREDVSEAWTGLPVRLALKVVDASCNPLAGAIVKIWHTNLEGVYSGQTPNPGMCSGNDAAAIAADFFRGVQTTAADGTVFFDTCFPGWYRGRAVHIHFQVKSGNVSYRVSQLFFPEAVITDIFTSHDEYAGFGQPDTTTSSDNIAGAIGDLAAHTLDIARMTDGAMLASKVVTVR